MNSLRARIYHQMNPMDWEGPGMSPVNSTVLTLVIASVVIAVLQSEPVMDSSVPTLFFLPNGTFAAIFTIEYGVRIWAMGVDPRYRGLSGAIRYSRSVVSLLDIVATLARWIDALFGVPGMYGVMLRLARALRILSLMQNSRMGTAIRLLRRAVRDRTMELSLSFLLAFVVLVVAATFLFLAEGEVQPEAFGSILRAMWWAMATLTTVGYGDVYLVTILGKFLAGLVAMTSIAIIAIPTGIMAAAFSDAFQELKRDHAVGGTAPTEI